MSKEGRSSYEINVSGRWPFQVCSVKNALAAAGFHILSCTSQSLTVDIDNVHLMTKALEFEVLADDYVIYILDSAICGLKWRKLIKNLTKP